MHWKPNRSNKRAKIVKRFARKIYKVINNFIFISLYLYFCNLVLKNRK